MASRVLAATPPRLPEVGEGRMKALPAAASLGMRVLSARIEPPVRFEEGSTASTATRWPLSVRYVPSASIVVDFPAPGMPVIPTRTALPVPGRSFCTSSRAAFWWSPRFDSISVMARATTARSPAPMPRTSALRSRVERADSDREAIGTFLNDHRTGRHPRKRGA